MTYGSKRSKITTMKIISAAFFYPGDIRYQRCLETFNESLRRSGSDRHEVQILHLQPPEPIDDIHLGWVYNHEKLRAYSEIQIDQPTAFVDLDVLFMHDIQPLFESEFDVAIAKRPGNQKSVYNGGVVLFHPTHAAREFMHNWIRVDDEMLHDNDFHMEYHRRYRGMNQSSFGYLAEQNPRGVKIKEYPTAVLNAVEQDYKRVRTLDPYIIHVRKKALEFAQSDTPLNDIPLKYREVCKIWRDYEAATATG